MLPNKSPVFRNILFWEFLRLFLRVLDFFRSFRALFLHVMRYQFQIWYIHSVCGAKHRIRVSLQPGHLSKFRAKSGSDPFLIDPRTFVDIVFKVGVFVELNALSDIYVSLYKIKKKVILPILTHLTDCGTLIGRIRSSTCNEQVMIYCNIFKASVVDMIHH